MASPTPPPSAVVEHDTPEASLRKMLKSMESFARELVHLSGEDGYKDIVATVQQNDTLRREKEELEKRLSSADANLLRIAENIKDVKLVEKERDSGLAELMRAQEEVAKLKTEITANNEEIDNTIKSKVDTEQKLEKLREECEALRGTQEQLAQLQEEHERDQRELLDFRSKAVSLKKVPKSDGPALIQQIHGIFEMAHILASRFFGWSDLDKHVFGGREWQALERDQRLAGIPLVPTNSEVANRMRVASFLRILASSALEHIFQPVYLTECGTEISEVIESLYHSDSAHAEWTRSVLLNIKPEEQAKNARARVKAVVEEVVESVDFLLQPAGRSDDFRAALQRWCEDAIQTWRELQHVEFAFHCLFEDEDSDIQAKEWTALPEPPSLRKEPTGTNGTSSPPNGSGQPNGAQASKQTHAVAPSNVAAQIWPVFLAARSDGRVKLARQGYLLTKLQVQAAREEAVPSRSQTRSHRSLRRQERARQLTTLPTNSTENFL